jgi:hypothetical protein
MPGPNPPSLDIIDNASFHGKADVRYLRPGGSPAGPDKRAAGVAFPPAPATTHGATPDCPGVIFHAEKDRSG